MGLKNKPGTFIDRYINNSNVNKHRALELKINYLKGLAFEYEKKHDEFIQKESQLIESYYLEDSQPLNNQLNGETKSDIKRNKLIKKFDQKAYWSRRRFKTSELRRNNEMKVESLLELWDKAQKDKKDDYLKILDQKYPHVSHNSITTNKIEAKIAILDERKAKQYKMMNLKSQKIQQTVKVFLKNNSSRIAKMQNKNTKLNILIANYNQKRLKEDQKLLDRYKPELVALQNTQHSEKQLLKLENHVDKIENVIKMIKDESIHLSVSHLKMYFGGIKAINDLTFDVQKGEIFGLIGPNGAGKTTVFNCITQFYKATSGNMILRNKENHIVNLDDYKTHDMIKEGIARSFQNVELIWELTVLDNLMVAAHSLLITSFFDHMAHTRKLLREDKVIRTKGYQILKNLGIEEYAFRSPYGLPYGVLKKIELARTLMTDPALIILDEPAAGLNDAETRDLANVIKKVNKEYGITIFLVEHDMGLVMSICDRICAISFGKLIGLGSPKEIQSNPEVRKAYLGDDDDE
ncbi:MAG: ATP-binding cassette domain-containing protein [Acholeplasmataceae bacterium]|nr:ATP-binding cassette domain-containing protein [Acholeplasmataceae bacterium]